MSVDAYVAFFFFCLLGAFDLWSLVKKWPTIKLKAYQLQQ